MRGIYIDPALSECFYDVVCMIVCYIVRSQTESEDQELDMRSNHMIYSLNTRLVAIYSYNNGVWDLLTNNNVVKTLYTCCIYITP